MRQSVLADSSQQVKRSAVGFHVADLVTVETLLVLVGIRLGISLVLVVFDLRLPLTILVLTVFAPCP